MTRNMARIIRGAEKAKTFVFPKSVWMVYEHAFTQIHALKYVVVNEGLTKFNSAGRDPLERYGPFSFSHL